MTHIDRSFEEIRDEFFVDPQTGDSGLLPGAAYYIARTLGGLSPGATTPEPSLTSEHQPELARFINELVSEYVARGRNFDHLSVAQLHPSGNIPAIAAHFASTILNNNTIIGEVSPVETAFERQAMDWMHANISGFDPDKASGALLSGGTSANMTAMLVAREKLQMQGWKGDQPVTIMANEMAHYSVIKAANLLAPAGLISVQHIPLEADSLKMDTDALLEAVKQHKAIGRPVMAIVGVAGETETGLVEDLATITDIGRSNGIYTHIDGAYGAPFRMSRQGGLFEGVSDADSLTCDPHKYLYVPYSAGAIMFRQNEDHALIERLNSDGADYMFREDEWREQAHGFKSGAMDFLGKKRIEGSMGGQAAASLHAIIETIGAAGIGKLLDHTMDMAEVFTDEMERAEGLKPLYSPELNAVCVIPDTGSDVYPEELQRQVEEVSASMEKEAGIYLSTTSLPLADASGERQKRKVFRFVATHPRTSEDDVRSIAETMQSHWNRALDN